MARTTSALVEGVLLSDYDSQYNLQPFIDTAAVVVTRVSDCAVSRGIPLTTAELELVERWLAAHFYATSDRPYQERTTDGARGKFQGETGMYLDSTFYGQQALLIDYSGCLASIGSGGADGSGLTSRNAARVVWLGKPPSEQIDYRDRD